MAALASLPMIDRPARGSGSLPHPPASASAVALLAQARNGLAAAEWEFTTPERFATSYLAALRAAAAALALRGRPHRGRARPMSVWVLLARVVPEFAEWAAFFESMSQAAATVRAGITGKVTSRDADDLLRQTGLFLSLVERAVKAGP